MGWLKQEQMDEKRYRIGSIELMEKKIAWIGRFIEGSNNGGKRIERLIDIWMNIFMMNKFQIMKIYGKFIDQW